MVHEPARVMLSVIEMSYRRAVGAELYLYALLSRRACVGQAATAPPRFCGP